MVQTIPSTNTCEFTTMSNYTLLKTTKSHSYPNEDLKLLSLGYQYPRGPIKVWITPPLFILSWQGHRASSSKYTLRDLGPIPNCTETFESTIPLHHIYTPARLHKAPLAPIYICPSLSENDYFNSFVFSSAISGFTLNENTSYLRHTGSLDQETFPTWDPFTSLRDQLWPLRHHVSW